MKECIITKRKQANNDKNEKHARALYTKTLSAVERKRKMTVTAQLLQPNGLTIDVQALIDCSSDISTIPQLIFDKITGDKQLTKCTRKSEISTDHL